MRISVLPNDPGFSRDTRGVEVIFNGVPCRGNVATADDEKGLIVVAKMAEGGGFDLDERGRIQYLTLYGEVVIARKPAPGMDPENNIVTVRNGKVLYL